MKKSATKPKRMAAAERRQQILQQAFLLIRDQGFKTVSVRDIARAAQVNEALIYKHFPTKDALLQGVVQEIVNRQPIHSVNPAENEEDFINQLQQFVDFFLGKTLQDPSLPKIILYAVMENYPLPDEFNVRKKGTFLNWMDWTIEKGKAEWGFNRLVDTPIYISLFMGGLIYFVLQASVVKTLPNLKQTNMQQRYVGLFLKALKA
jgi:AcrR family transcriptional regulator